MMALQSTDDFIVADPPALLSPSAVREAVGTIFSGALGLGPVDDNDDFFDLGGDSLKAIALMIEIGAVLGRDLPITAIYDAPTVATLAALLLGENAAGDSNLALLRPGEGTNPLFIAHGLGGTVMELRPLAHAIATDQAIYGIEARGLDGNAEPFESVPDMARFHIGSVRRIQPAGPYFLAGYSFGGLVAFEMAKILTRMGEQVAFVGLLDTFPHTKFWPLRARIASWGQLAKFSGARSTLRRLFDYHRGVLRGKSGHAATVYIFDRAWRAFRLSLDIFRFGAWLQRFADFAGPPAHPPEPVQAATIPPTLRRVQRAGDVAYRTYRPDFYDGEITFVKASREMRVPFDARVLWGTLARRVTVHSVVSDHQSLIRTDASDLARLLSQCLRNALVQLP